MKIEFFAPGCPKPGGSKTAFKHPKTGKMVVTDSCKGNKDWRSSVAFFAKHAYNGDPFTGIVFLEVIFVLKRPKNHFNSKQKLKDSAPLYHCKKPDATKLLRSTEDALTGILWKDDAQICRQTVEKIYGDKTGAYITVRIVKEGEA